MGVLGYFDWFISQELLHSTGSHREMGAGGSGSGSLIGTILEL
jgi:hypothetical protein